MLFLLPTIAPVSTGPRHAEASGGGPTLIGRIGGTVQAVATDGANLYARIGDDLVVLDIGKPGRPVETARLSGGAVGILRLATIDGNIYGAAASGLTVFDPHGSGAPRVIARLAFDGARIVAMASVGGRVYLADRADGGRVHIVDARDPARPTPAGTIIIDRPDSFLKDLAAAGSWIFVLGIDIGGQDEASFVLAYEFRDRQWRPRGTVATRFVAQNIATSRGLLFVTGYTFDLTHGLEIFDVRDPARPVALAVVNLDRFSSRVRVAGARAFVTNYAIGGDTVRDTGQLVVVDIANPARPRVESIVEVGDDILDAAVSGDHVYLAAQAAGLQTIDVASAAQARAVDVRPVVGHVAAVAASRTHLFALYRPGHLLASPRRLAAFGIADTQHPVSLGSVGTVDWDSTFTRLAAGGPVSAIFDPHESAVDFYHADDAPPALRYVGRLALGKGTRAIWISEDRAYVAIGRAVRVFDLRIDGPPIERGALALATIVEDVVVEGESLYAVTCCDSLSTDAPTVHVIDARDLARPRTLGTLRVTNTRSRERYRELIDSRLTVAGGFAYLYHRTPEIHVIDVNRPSRLSRVAVIPYHFSSMIPYFDGLTVAGDRLWAWTVEGELAAFRTMSARSPCSRLTALGTTEFDSWGAVVSGHRAYLAQSNGIGVVDLDAPHLAPDRACAATQYIPLTLAWRR